MTFDKTKHNNNLYSNLLFLSRNIFFYKKINLPDTFETRIYLMFFHFSILMIIFKKKGKKFNQKIYDFFFHNIENDLRELGFGDVSVNKKMKEMNKILYDILLKVEITSHEGNDFVINNKLVEKYFFTLKDPKSLTFREFLSYFSSFYDFCFELPLDIVLNKLKNFKI